MGNKLKFVLLSIALTLVFNGCATNKKTLLVAYPDYFELPAGTEMTLDIDTGYGPHQIQVRTKEEMGCYSARAQVDALSIKKGKH